MLTRLADESYDLVFIDADPVDQPDFVVEGVRLLRPGGAIVVHRAALGGRAGDAKARDAEVTAVREAARLIAEDERLTPVLVPLGDGLLAAARDWPSPEEKLTFLPASDLYGISDGQSCLTVRLNARLAY